MRLKLGMVGLGAAMSFGALGCSSKAEVKMDEEAQKETPMTEGSDTAEDKMADVSIVVLERPGDAYENVEVMSPIYFAFESSTLDEVDQAVLDGFYAAMAERNPGPLTLIGHADEPGGDEFNKDLGLKRAEAVKAYLVSKGADPAQISTRSQGETDLAVDTQGAQRHWKNRRVEFLVSMEEGS